MISCKTWHRCTIKVRLDEFSVVFYVNLHVVVWSFLFLTIFVFPFATASAPPLADPTISKDINLYFSGDLSIHNAPGGGNLVVTDDTSEQALNSGFSPRDVYSAHRPHTAQHSSEYPTGNEMSTIPQSPSSPANSKPAALPVAALAVPVSHIVVHDADIAIAEVYLGEVEEYKE